jgi:hypothetical protein
VREHDTSRRASTSDGLKPLIAAWTRGIYGGDVPLRQVYLRTLQVSSVNYDSTNIPDVTTSS